MLFLPYNQNSFSITHLDLQIMNAAHDTANDTLFMRYRQRMCDTMLLQIEMLNTRSEYNMSRAIENCLSANENSSRMLFTVRIILAISLSHLPVTLSQFCSLFLYVSLFLSLSSFHCMKLHATLSSSSSSPCMWHCILDMVRCDRGKRQLRNGLG